MVQVTALQIERKLSDLSDTKFNEVFFVSPFSETERTFINTTMRELYCLCFLPKFNRVYGIKL